jgi:4-amino-4-deoxy-L-arabinose transferase-like glycosyltransferase
VTPGKVPRGISERRESSRHAWFALGVIAVLGAIYAGIAHFAFAGFPYSGDEYSLALQGELFARGALHAPVPPHPEWLRVDHVMIDAVIRSKYPPGAAFLLALGEARGVAWLVTPLEGVIGLVVLWHTVRRVLGAREALVALIVAGLSPLYAFEAASFYAHTATVMFLAIALAGVAGWTRAGRPESRGEATGVEGHTGWLILTGAALGCAFLTRPIDALLFGGAMLALRSWRAVIVPGIAALPLVAVNFWYQARQFGSPFTDGYHAYQPTLEALYGVSSGANPLSFGNLWDPIQLWNHLDIYRAFSVGWTVPGAVVVALFGAFAIGRDHPARPMRAFSLAMIAIYAAGLLITVADPDDGPRPRYLTPLVLPIALLAAAGYASVSAALVARFGRRIRTIIVAAAVLFGALQIAAFVYERVPLVWYRSGLYQAVGDAGLGDAVVIIRAQHPSRFARNGPWFDGVLYLSPPVDVSAEAIAAAYPGRAIWEAHEGRPWKLTRVR